MTNSDRMKETLDAFWGTIPPLWHQIRAQIRADAVENFDITVGQFHILRRIHFGMDSVSKLADDKHISRAAVSRAVDMLVNKGLIRRTPDPADRRCVRLSLTDAGQALLDALFENTRDWMAGKMASLDDAGLEKITQAIQYLKRAFE